MPNKSQLRTRVVSGSGLVFLSSFFYGTYGVWNRMLGPEVGAFSQAAWRSLLIALILIPILIKSKKFYLPNFRTDLPWLLLMAFGSVFSQSASFISVNRIGIGLSVTTMFTVYVLLLMLWGAFYDKLPFTGAQVVSLLVSVIGLVLLFHPTGIRLDVVGVLLAVLSGFAITATTVSGRNFSGGPLHALFIGWGMCAITNGLIAVLIHEHTGPLFATPKISIVLAYTTASLAASFTLQSGVRKISAALTGLIGLLENVFALAFGTLFFNERMGAIALLGASLILLAIAVPDIQAMMSRRKKQLVRL